MAYAKPTLAELIEAARADIEAQNPRLDAHATNSVASVLAHVQAAGLHAVYGYLDWVAKQILPDESDKEVLERQAGLRDLAYLDPVAATGPVIVAGTADAVLPADTILQSSAGIEYRVTADAVVGSNAAVEAVEPGEAGNLAAGSRLTLQVPVDGIQGALLVGADGLTGGADQESVEHLRQRLLQIMRAPPQGGAEADYVKWALEAHPSVTRVWVSDEDGPPYVNVRIVCDEAVDGPAPSAAVLEAVQAKLDAEKPVAARPTALSPTFDDITISIQLDPDELAVREAVEAELADLFRREAEPGGTIPLSHINEAISIAVGEYDHAVTVPNADIVSATGHMPRFAGVTWL